MATSDTEVMHVRIPTKLYRRLSKIADETHRTRHNLVLVILESTITQIEKEMKSK